MDHVKRPRADYVYLRIPSRAYRFPATVISSDEKLLVIGTRLYPVGAETAGDPTVRSGDIGIWFLFKGMSWDVGCIYSPAGEFRGFYADAVEPLWWEGSDPHSLAPIVDLFVDIWILPDGGYSVLDEKELEEAVERRYVSRAQADEARRTIEELRVRVEKEEFPPPVVRDFSLSPADLSELTSEDFRAALMDVVA